MKILVFILLLYSLLSFGYRQKEVVTTQLNEQIKGRWTSNRTQLQYIVDSHLVHEEEITTERGKTYDFDGMTVRVTYPNGATAQGTYSVVMEDDKKKVVLQLLGTTTSYHLLAVTPTSMAWQKDLDDVYYYEGFTQKSAERALYTEEFKK